MIKLEFPEVYSTNQKRVLMYGISNNIEVGDIKNPGIPSALMEAFIECRAAGYDIEELEDCNIGSLSLTYLDCIRELVRHDIDIYQLIDNGRFIDYDNRQILTITDGLLQGLNIKYFKNKDLSYDRMRIIINNLSEIDKSNKHDKASKSILVASFL